MSDAADQPKQASVEPKQITEVKTTRQITASRFSPDGAVLAAVGFDSAVWRWRMNGNELIPAPPLPGHQGWATALAFHPTQPHLFTVDSWGGMQAHHAHEEAPKLLWKNEKAHEGWIRQIAVSPDGQYLATCGRDCFSRVWEAASGKLITEHRATEDLFAVIFQPNGWAMVFGDARGRLEAWDFAAKKSIRIFDAAVLYRLDRIQDIPGLRNLLLVDDGKTLVASGTTPQNGATPQSIPTVLFFDYESGKLKQTFTHGTNKEGYVHDLVRHPTGYLMAVTSGSPGSGMLFLFRAGEKEPFHVNTKMPNCHALALHPDGKRFIVTSTNRDSNGNGRKLTKEGEYATNTSPLHLFELPA